MFTQTVHLFDLLIMKNIIIHCKESILDNKEDFNLNYQFDDGELNVIIPYNQEAIDINNRYSDDEEFVNHYGLDYDLVNMIELV